ncbi:MAG: hypothetical protein J6T37_01450 [Bacteroidales bacterium]|nr:hypothetical protein [Bacteroidaceae bacterium]MBO5707684.1 hypothetical protein [Bacteroidaceae bacterium]MBO7528261.1 hypothetical protein [Bacteroidales bacterium]MBO7528522.1 hypothetical protein [Bacteroidales bacterium]
MEISFDTLINIAGLFLSGSVGGFVAWKWQRRKMKAEAQTEEVNMAKAVQDTYQQMLKDKEEEVADKNRIITELREDRDHFRQDRNELRERIDKTESLVRELQEQVSENRREIDMMRPFLCGVLGCKLRKPVAISAAPSAEKPKKQTKKKEA